jgi:glycosyltransferase involved in cell wall biosynthesis
MGRTVVAYDIRGMREVIDPTLGLLVPRGDQSALARVVRGLLEDPDRCSELGDRSRQWVTSRFSEDLVLDRLRKVYADMTGSAA